MKYVLVSLMMSWNIAIAQSGDWQDSYPSMDFGDLLSHCQEIMGPDIQTCESTCLSFYGLLDVKYEVAFTYQGDAAELRSTKRRYLDDWIKTYLGDRYKDMFQHEITFSHDSVNYRIAVQEATLPYYSKELKKGDSVFLYLAFVGTIVEDGSLEYIFVANDFLKAED